MSPISFTIRPALATDSLTLVNLVRELAVYERLESSAIATPEAFQQHLFGPDRAAEALLAIVDGEAVGFALFFSTFSTFRGKPGLYLEDLFVRPAYRGFGLGKGLLSSVAQRAVESGCGRLEWAVLDWNAPAIAFYKAAGARPLDDWTVYRVDEQRLMDLANLDPTSREARRE
ncbi:MAG: GNAT family N-acetyltransferase [Isosphaeraceae bacterium]